MLILMLGPVSGAHFNPVVTGMDCVLGRAAGSGISGRDTTAYVCAHTVGAVGGAVLANAMFRRRPGSRRLARPREPMVDVTVVAACSGAR